MDCIFCDIISGKAEASKIYEDDSIVAFMDIQPVRKGQVLIIPKEHIDHFSDIPDELAEKIFLKAHHISRIMREKLECERVGLVVHGYGVPHAHMVIVPQHREDDITSGKMAELENGQIVFTVKNLPIAPRSELDTIARLLKGD
ncbi:MAG: HIT family protein [Patescibacteria group bacterium]|nr:HIT family protein [Patescibacteria group bacterium]